MYKRTSFPKLIVDLEKLRENTSIVNRRCKERGIHLTGVIKGCTGLTPCAEAFEEAGVDFIASSRLEQLAAIRESGVTTPLQMIRIPHLTEAEDVVRICDMSLNSEMEVLRALNEAALAQGKIHRVILMIDCGDLREGFWDRQELLEAALAVEHDMPGLELAGTGTNLGCYGSVMATPAKLQELVDATEELEAALGRRLEYISGGSSTSYFRVLDGTIPPRINMLRIGEAILVPAFMFGEFGAPLDGMNTDVFTIQAEILEIRDKPSHPVGEIGFDAFGHRVQYVDRGIRRRALLGLGKCDYGSWEELTPRDPDLEIIGASSDHTIVDVQNAIDNGKEPAVGDIAELGLNYASLVFVSNTPSIAIEYRK